METNGARQVHYDSGPNMTPLVDVVMVILIFLMLAGNFGGDSRYLVSKAGIHSPARKPLTVDENAALDLEINVDQLPAADGFSAVVAGKAATSSRSNLKNLLESIRATDIANGKSPDKLQVVIYPGGSLKYIHLIQVYDAALRAKFEKVSFAEAH